MNRTTGRRHHGDQTDAQDEVSEDHGQQCRMPPSYQASTEQRPGHYRPPRAGRCRPSAPISSPITHVNKLKSIKRGEIYYGSRLQLHEVGTYCVGCFQG